MIPITALVIGPGGNVEISNDVGNPIPVSLDGGPISLSGEIALDAATLAALEQITVFVAAGQIIGLDAATLAALEQITVSGTVALDAPTLAALENINAVVSGTVELGTATLAALEDITATVTGSVSVSNFPSSVEISNDVGSPVPVNGTVEVTNDVGNPLPVEVTNTSSQGQLLDANNTKTITAADASPGSPWVGVWTTTRSADIVRLLTVIAGTSSTVGGTFTFQFSENGISPTISETRMIGDFSEVRDFDLINAGEFYRVSYEPAAPLGADLVFINTTLRRQDDGAFVRLANQEIEEANAAMGQTFAYPKAFDPRTGKSVNIRASNLGALRTEDQRLTVTQSGSLFSEGIRDDIGVIFSRDQGAASIATMVDESPGTNGSITHDPVDGQAVFAVPAVANSLAFYTTSQTVAYESGHMIRGGMTVVPSALPTTGRIEWGFGEANGGGTLLNAVGWGIDAGGIYTMRVKNGVQVTKTYSPDFSEDRLDGLPPSRYLFDGSPQLFPVLGNNIYEQEFEWYGVAPPTYLVSTPTGSPIVVNVEQTVGQTTGTTIPEPNLPMFIRITNGSTAEALNMQVGSMRGGIITNKVAITAQQPDGDWVSQRASGLARDRDGLDISTTTPLAANATYTSGWMDTDGWSGIEVSIATNQLSAAEGIVLEFTDDTQVAVPVVRSSTSRTFSTIDAANGFLIFRLGVRLDGFRIKYTNGATPQGSFFLEVVMRAVPVELPQGPFGATIGPTNVAVMTRGSLIAPDSSGTAFANIERGTNGGLDVGIVQHEVETPIESLSSIVVNQSNVTTTAALIITPTANRRSVSIRALLSNGQKVYIGGTGAVTSGNGYELGAGAAVDMDLDDGQAIYMISNSGTQRVCWVEAIR